MKECELLTFPAPAEYVLTLASVVVRERHPDDFSEDVTNSHCPATFLVSDPVTLGGFLFTFPSLLLS